MANRTARRPSALAKPWSFLASGLLLLFFLTALSSLPSTSITTDEPLHYRYGRKILNSDAGRFDDSKMPVSALNAFPAWLGERLPDSRLARGLRNIQVARVPTLLVAVGLGWVIYVWSRRLYGAAAGLFSLFLYTFDPNVLAHARLITTDVYCAASISLALYLSWRFARHRSVLRGAAAAIAIGLAQVTKYTAVALFPITFLVFVVYDGPRLIRAGRRFHGSRIARYILRSLLWAMLTVVVTLGIINVAFLREYTLAPLRDYEFQSRFWQSVQRSLSAAEWVRVPVPRPYLEGLDAVMYRERSGVGYGQVYLLGQLRRGEGFPGYFVIASFLKTPLATSALLGIALALWIRHFTGRSFVRRELFLLVPWLVFGIYFNFLFRAQIGVRLVLMMTPLAAVFGGLLVQDLAWWGRGRQIALALALGSIALSTLSYHPDFLAYFNEVVWDRRLAYRFLADSNLDWGQSERSLKLFLAAHPEALVEPAEVEPGWVVVRVNNLVGITDDPAHYASLREECIPAETVGHAYLAYRVPCAEGGPAW